MPADVAPFILQPANVATPAAALTGVGCTHEGALGGPAIAGSVRGDGKGHGPGVRCDHVAIDIVDRDLGLGGQVGTRHDTADGLGSLTEFRAYA